MIKNRLNLCFYAVFVLVLAWVFLSGLSNVAFGWGNTLVVAGGMIIGWLLVYRLVLLRLNTMSARASAITAAALLLCFFAGCLWFGVRTMSYHLSDLEVLYNAVACWVETGNLQPYNHYFTVCTNTLGNCVMLFLWYWPLGLFQVPMDSRFAEIWGIGFNVLMITLTILFVYLLACKIFSKHSERFLVLCMSMVYAPYFLWSHRFYSDTLSMPFVPLAFLLYFHAEGKARTKVAVLCLLSGVAAGVAGIIRGSAAVAVAALVIYDGITHFGKRLLCTLLPFLLAVVCCNAVWSYTIHNSPSWVDLRAQSSRYPMTTWLLYGAHDDGNYSDDDINYLQALGHYEARKEAASIRLKEYYSRYTFPEYIQFLSHKFSVTWSDGKYDADKYLVDQVEKSWIHTVITPGAKWYPLYTYFSNGQHFAALLMMGLCAVVLARKREWSPITLMQITILGLILFLCFWETKPRYVLGFTPFFPLMTACGVATISAWWQGFAEKMKKNRIEKKETN